MCGASTAVRENAEHVADSMQRRSTTPSVKHARAGAALLARVDGLRVAAIGLTDSGGHDRFRCERQGNQRA